MSKWNIGDKINNWQIVNVEENNNYRNRLCDCICLVCRNVVYNRLLRTIVNSKTTQCLNCSYNIKRKCNLLPLLENNHLAYYYHGLIYADGSIYAHLSNELNMFQLSLQIKDKSYLQKLADLLSTTIHIVPTKKQNEQDMVRIGVKDKILVQKLAKLLNIQKQKTYNPPNQFNLNWNYEQRLSISIGFIDGDGSRIKNSGIKVVGHKNWLEMYKYIFDGLYSQCKLNSRNEAFCYINRKGVDILEQHIKKYHLPVLKRKWTVAATGVNNNP